MTHWKNPFDEAVPVPIEELAECYAYLGQQCASSSGNFIWTKEKVLKHWGAFDDKPVDAYILPQPSGNHCIGIRYGAADSEYLSPEGNKEKVQALLDRYNSSEQKILIMMVEVRQLNKDHSIALEQQDLAVKNTKDAYTKLNQARRELHKALVQYGLINYTY